ncbi:hypothetical protein GCM10009681_52380 [Luedemannella helvata]|uniref:Uncharacterized protein n=1 Tax=Luedemannella helvata TaxID=349315 RepID=A0ABP4XDC9_9ACTN
MSQVADFPPRSSVPGTGAEELVKTTSSRMTSAASAGGAAGASGVEQVWFEVDLF